MDPVKWILLISVISWQIFQGLSKLKIDLDPFEIMTEQLGMVLNNCKSLQTNAIGVFSDSNDSIKWTVKSLRYISMVNLKNTNKKKQFSRFTYARPKLHTFVIITPSTENLKYLIGELRTSIWWNPSAVYIIIDNLTVKTGCKNASPFLRMTWEQDILFSTFLCANPKNGFSLYAFNPFTRDSPIGWQEVMGNDVDHRNHTWTMFERKFIPDQTTCQSFKFDKTKNLGGYPINVIGFYSKPGLAIDFAQNGIEQLGGVDGSIARFIWRKLNASLNVTIDANHSGIYQYLPEVSSGKYDMLANSQYVFNKINYSMIYPTFASGISILTKHPGYVMEPVKIVRFMNPIFLMAALVITTATVIILAVGTDQGMMRAILEVLRIMLGVGMVHFPRRIPLRIYMMTIFLLYMHTTSTFQSNLSSLLTSPISKPRINTKSELIESNFPIYIFRGYRNAIFDETLRQRLRIIDQWDCTEYVLKYENVACAAERVTLRLIAFENDLHLSKHRLTQLYLTYIVRPNWPLTDRIGYMSLRILEAGLYDLWMKSSLTFAMRKWMAPDDVSATDEYHVLKLSDLWFVFYILFFGLGVSFLTFLLELAIKHWHERKVRNRERIPVFPFTH